MARLRVRVGPKGQIVIPKALRETYRIREGGYVILEAEEDGLKIRGAVPPEEIIQWIRERRSRVKGRRARLGELASVDLEEEFES